MAPNMRQTTSRQLSPFQDLICGAFAGMTARMAVAPLDVVKIRFQVQSHVRGRYKYATVAHAFRSIVRNEGILALWKGNVPALLMVSPYAAIQLASFYQIHSKLTFSHQSPLREPYLTLGVAAISSSFATLATYPLDLLRTRLAANPSPVVDTSITGVSMWREAKDIVYTRGLSGLYSGLQPTMIEIVPYMALNLLIYERLKHHVTQRLDENAQRQQLWHTPSIAATAGTVSKLLTLPLDNAKKVLQVQYQFSGNCLGNRPSSLPIEYRGIFDCLQSLWRRDGIISWFRGTIPSLLKAAPNSAITYMTYEAAKSYISGPSTSSS